MYRAGFARKCTPGAKRENSQIAMSVQLGLQTHEGHVRSAIGEPERVRVANQQVRRTREVSPRGSVKFSVTPVERRDRSSYARATRRACRACIRGRGDKDF